MPTSPLIILVINACILGAVASVLVLLAISVDSWQNHRLLESKLTELNKTENNLIIKRISSSTIIYEVEDTSMGINKSQKYCLYNDYVGLWRVCNDLTASERASLPSGTFITEQSCFIFVMDYHEDQNDYSDQVKQLARLQNSAASCYIVVIIDLISAAVVGLIGILKKQVASCMITGVLYCMAALFGIFGLCMFHAKDFYEKYDCYSLNAMPRAVCGAREVTLGWAIIVAWFGVIFCAVACILWLIVARALRVIKAKTML